MNAGAQLPECQQTHTSSPPYSGAPAGHRLQLLKGAAGQWMQQGATRTPIDKQHGIVASLCKVQVPVSNL